MFQDFSEAHLLPIQVSMELCKLESYRGDSLGFIEYLWGDQYIRSAYC